MKKQGKKDNTKGPGLQPLRSDSKSPRVSKKTQETETGCDLNEITLKVPGTPYIHDSVSTRKRKGRLNLNNNYSVSESTHVQNHKGFLRRHWHAFIERVITKHQETRREVHIIDKISRVLFPVAFLIFNVAYFITVLYFM